MTRLYHFNLQHKYIESCGLKAAELPGRWGCVQVASWFEIEEESRNQEHDTRADQTLRTGDGSG
jgi:hypothetical protein